MKTSTDAAMEVCQAFMDDDRPHTETGLYAEQIRNRAFQMNDTGGPPDLSYYNLIQDGGSSASIALDSTVSLNYVLTHTLRLDVRGVGSGGRAGFSNEGWWGIRISPDETYNASFWAKSNNYTGPLNVSIESTSGSVLASAVVKGISSNFTKYSVQLTPKVSNTTTDNIFAITTSSQEANGASIWFDVISLFPPTYKNRPNGLRADIAQIVQNTAPSIFRFPGGNNLEGQTIEQRWKWNETVGPIELRPGRLGDWGYANTDGQGLLEYLEMCEDIGMEPILAVWAGYALNHDSVPQDQLGPYVQDTLNELEYVMGNTSTTYGVMRARDGHPEPFQIKWIEIGNDYFFSSTYNYRYQAWYDAIKAAYPKISIIATASQTARPFNVIDNHYYNNGPQMTGDFDLYDNYPRNGTTVFVGEFGTNINGCCGSSSADVQAAISDATFITGLERNSDVVEFIAYAPSFTRDGQSQWNPDLIGFNTKQVWGTPSYHVMQMWSTHRSDTILRVDASNGGFNPLYWVAGQKNATKEIFVKVANYGNATQTVSFNVRGAKVTKGVATTLTGNPTAINSAQAPNNVIPTNSTFNIRGDRFKFTFPALSASVLALSP
ncbi:hypothetical protein BZG36_05243 [Bifiguratus adelaidae]|uniref:non-reducing end alpha-L-arabinofuranosidase n=1 Tax=Bifiguratus adelaidae TaxID=1938954 RepID=A0A261XTS0_9FUNG|nr:hypothetical protein BZG36_05243 [Bifiguratus adelaidae]